MTDLELLLAVRRTISDLVDECVEGKRNAVDRKAQAVFSNILIVNKDYGHDLDDLIARLEEEQENE